MSEEAKKVIIIGGAYAGVQAANLLHRSKVNLDITLFNRNTSFNINLGNVRSVADPEFIEQLWAPYTNIFHPNTDQRRTIAATVTDVFKESGQKYEFDYLIIATGSQYAAPFKFTCRTPPEAKEECTTIHTALSKGTASVLIIGGGDVGCEFAGEIKSGFPQLKVKIVHSGPRLFHSSRYKEAVSTKAHSQLTSLGIEIEKITTEVPTYSLKPLVVTSESGKIYEADVVFKCAGIASYNSGLIKSLYEEYGVNMDDALTKNGRVKVKPTCQLAFGNITHIFAVGDVCDIDPRAHVEQAIEAGTIAAKNIIALIQGKPSIEYKGNPNDIALISLGRNGGVGQIAGGFVVGSFISRMFKGSDLSTAKYWRSVNCLTPE